MSKQVLSARVDESLLEWLDAYAAKAGSKRGDVLEAALRDLKDSSERAPVDLSEVPERKKVARPGLRHAAMCDHPECVPPFRVFLGSEEEADAWRCPEHGRARRQVNRPYMGQSTVA
jgi:hypothetical protein